MVHIVARQDLGANFCPHCGGDLRPAEAPSEAAPAKPKHFREERETLLHTFERKSPDERYLRMLCGKLMRSESAVEGPEGVVGVRCAFCEQLQKASEATK